MDNTKEKNNFKIGECGGPIDKSYSDLDTLGFEPARQAFLKVIKKVEPPLTIGLYGPWGSGKSRMIEGLADELKGDGYLTLVFDAWKYRHEQNLVLPLICTLEREHLPKLEDIKDSAKKVVTSVALVMANQFLRNKVGVDIGEVRGALGVYEDGYKHYKKYADNVANIEQEYKKFITTLLTKTEKKVVIFVDNLDRCLPDVVINLLEDISSFLTIRGVPCIYVLAMDKEHVVKALRHRFPGFDSTHYLEKIVQVGLSMPSIDDPGIWAHHFQNRIGLNSQKEIFLFGLGAGPVLDELQKIPDLLCSGGILDNPRRIERFVNKYLVLHAMGKISHTEKKEGIICFIFSLLLKDYFPIVYEALKKDKDEKYLVSLISWSRNPSKTQEAVKTEAQAPGHNILNDELFQQYIQNNDFYKFLKTFSAPLPGDTLGILNIKKVLDLVD